MPGPAHVSCARNGEDVVLLRALGHLDLVRYIALTTTADAADLRTDALEASGWEGQRGAVPNSSGELRDAIGTLGSTRAPLHVLWCVAPDRADEVFSALAGVAARPWVVVVKLSSVGSGDLGPAANAVGYDALLFDGESRFFVAQEHSELAKALSYPRCSRDGYETDTEVRLRGQAEALLGEVIHWRRLAVTTWADAVAGAATTHLRDDVTGAEVEAVRLRDELTAMTQTLSWRATAPLRAVRRLPRRLRARS